MNGTRTVATIGRSRAGPRPPARYGVTLLGSFRVVDGDSAVAVPAGLQRLLARLALRGPTGRGRLADLLWPDTPELRALANLRTALWRANHVAPGLLEVSGDVVALSDDVDVDVTRVLRAAHRVLARDAEGPTDALSDETRVLLEECDVLPDWPDEWLVPDRERLGQLRLHVLEALAARLTAGGQFGAAMEAALAALRSDPLRETAHRAVIRVHVAEGNLAAARHAVDECAAVLSRDLGVTPAAATYALLRDVGT